MNKLALTIFASSIVLTTAAGAATPTNSPATATATAPTHVAATGTTKNTLPARHRLHRQHKAQEAVVKNDEAQYSEMRIGDPRIVYHEIGTSGAQRDNTVIPFYNEPIRSSKPYEIRYDYSEFNER